MLSRTLIFLWALCLALPAAAAPKLLVIVSVDQMRADYFDRYATQFSSGLKTLFEQGAFWTEAHHTHIPTETGPGHSVILTGKYPGGTGIVGNGWWDRASSTDVYCVRDSVHGLGPENLLAYTLGDALKAKDPASRVVSLSMKDRAAILMGGKKADAAIWFDKKNGEFTSSSYYGAKPGWLAGFNAKLRARGVKAKKFLATPEADRVLLELVEEAALEYQVGVDTHTDILAVSFSATDYIGHEYGPDSPEMKKQLMQLDNTLGELIGFLTVQLGKDNFDLVLTADHAVIPVPEQAAGKKMGGRRVLKSKLEDEFEKILQALHPAPGKKWLMKSLKPDVYFLPNIYLNRALAEREKLDWPSLLKEAAKAFREVDGVAQIYVPGEWDARDRYAEVHRRSYNPLRSGDLIMLPKEGVLADDGDLTGHGSPYRYDTNVPLVFFGVDFKTGLFAEFTRVTDLAPTCARLLGVDFPPTDGSRVLEEVFRTR